MPDTLRSIARGSELVAALTETFGSKSGWLKAMGEVEGVELRLAGATGEAQRSYPHRYTIVDLGGPVGGPYGVVLARLDGERQELIAGMLVRAHVLEARVLWTAAALELSAPEPKGPAGAAQPARWSAQVAQRARALSAQAEAEEASEEWVPERGDLIQHFAFGLCEVVSSDGDRLTTRDLTGTGRIREIRTRHLRIEAPTDHEGKRLFRLLRRD